jgi:HK97 family phage portal protein
MLRLYGIGGSFAQIYASQPNVRTVVDTIAREAAELTLKMYEKVPRSGILPDGRVDIGDHPMMQLLEEPTPGESTYDFYYALFADISIYDLAIWQKVRLAEGAPPRALLRIPPVNLIPVRHPVTGAVDYWRGFDGRIVLPSDLVVFWGYDPSVNHGSIAPMETMRRLLAEELAAGMNREGMWSNATRKEGVIEQVVDATKMSDEARESFLVDVEDNLSGSAGASRPLLLEPGMSWQDVSWSPKEMEYISARKLSRLEVAAAFHVPPALVGAAANGQEPDDKTMEVFYSSSLPPRLSRVESTIEAQLLPDFDLVQAVRRRRYVEFNLATKLRGSFEKQAAIMSTTAGGPVITVNEGRGRLNLPPLAGGDLIFVPLNSIRAGGPQASPQSPTDTPAQGVQPVGTTPGGGTLPTTTLGAAAAPVDWYGTSAMSVEDVLAEHESKMAEAKSAAEHASFLRESRVRYEERHARMLEKFFSRQRNAVVGGKAADSERWDRELADDMFGVQYQTVEAFGKDAAGRIGGAWDQERTAAYVRKRSDAVAQSLNAETAQRLAAEGADPDEVFGEPRVQEFSRTHTTFAVNWAIQEAAHQNGA